MAANFEAKIATPLTAAMETAGAVVQSKMLDFISGQEGLQLAGLLYLVAIAAGILIFASGGNYKWGRYLLVGPTLFMFLVTVRTETDGTEWSWGSKDFSRETVEYALKGIQKNEDAASANISTVFHVWNAMMSETIHTLITLFRFDTSDNNFNFISKLERYMSKWNFSHIHDPDLKALIHLVLIPECKEYFYAQHEVSRVVTLPQQRNAQEEFLSKAKKAPIINFLPETHHSKFSREFWEWANKNEFTGGSYSCDTLWNDIVDLLKKDMTEVVRMETEGNSVAEQDESISREMLNRKMGEYVGRMRNVVDSDDGGENAAALYAVNWIIARSLALEMNSMDRFSRTHLKDNASAIHMEASGQELAGGSAGYTPQSSASLQQFYQTEEYGFRSLYVTAAMSMPYLQGLGLLILSATFPFFAILLIVPGRAAGIFTWFGLWAWIKLWDLGYAIVTMIDNMLYSMFPKGPNISDQDLNQPGLAIVKAFEVDPNYSYANYYMIISTCLLAVPVVTGVFVKGAGNELINIFHTSLSDYSYKIAGGVMSFARAEQAQDALRQLQKVTEKAVDKAYLLADQEAKSNGLYDRYIRQSQIVGLLSSANNLLTFASGTAASAFKAHMESKRDQTRAIIAARREELKAEALYSVRKNEARYYANIANLSRYYSHELSTQVLPAREKFGREIAGEYYNTGKVLDAIKGKLLHHAADASQIKQSK